MDDGNSVTTRLLTLLNVSAVKSGKRKRIYEDLSCSTVKLNKRRVAVAENVDNVHAGTIESKTIPDSQGEDVSGQDVEVEGDFRIFSLSINALKLQKPMEYPISSNSISESIPRLCPRSQGNQSIETHG